MKLQLNKIIQGHVLDILKDFPDKSVHCCFTSPPYWALRVYQTNPQIWDAKNGCVHEWIDSYEADDFRFRGENSSVSNHKNTNIWKVIKHKTGETNPGKESWYKNKGACDEKPSQFCIKCGAWRGELGLEPNFNLYIKHLADSFDEFKRVLNDYGTLWINIADTYSGSGCGANDYRTEKSKSIQGVGKYRNLYKTGGLAQKINYPAKSLIMIPHRFAIEMVNRGWVHRQTIIWKKPNCLPSSALDRFTIDFEYIFLFTKGIKVQYYTNEKTLQITRKKPLGLRGIENKDWEWIKCQFCDGTGKKSHSKEIICKNCNGTGRKKRSLWSGHDYFFNQQFEEYTTELNRWGGNNLIPNGTCDWAIATGQEIYRLRNMRPNKHGRNMRTVWEMSFDDYMNYCSDLWHINNKLSSIWKIKTEPFPAAHFACFPRALAKIPIDAGCPQFVCNKCGLPRVKIYRFTGDYDIQGGIGSKTAEHINVSPSSSIKTKKVKIKEFAGYSDCGCNANYHPGVVMDNFAGSGTTCQVASEMNRNFVGIEINPDYIDIANNYRLNQQVFNFN